METTLRKMSVGTSETSPTAGLQGGVWSGTGHMHWEDRLGREQCPEMF